MAAKSERNRIQTFPAFHRKIRSHCFRVIVFDFWIGLLDLHVFFFKSRTIVIYTVKLIFSIEIKSYDVTISNSNNFWTKMLQYCLIWYKNSIPRINEEIE